MWHVGWEYLRLSPFLPYCFLNYSWEPVTSVFIIYKAPSHTQTDSQNLPIMDASYLSHSVSLYQPVFSSLFLCLHPRCWFHHRLVEYNSCHICIEIQLPHSVQQNHGQNLWEWRIAMIIFWQFYSHMLTVCGRSFANIYRHIKHAAFDDTHQFTLRKRRLLKMKPSKYSVWWHTLIVLHEIHLVHLLFKFPLGKDSKK